MPEFHLSPPLKGTYLIARCNFHVCILSAKRRAIGWLVYQRVPSVWGIPNLWPKHKVFVSCLFVCFRHFLLKRRKRWKRCAMLVVESSMLRKFSQGVAKSTERVAHNFAASVQDCLWIDLSVQTFSPALIANISAFAFQHAMHTFEIEKINS